QSTLSFTRRQCLSLSPSLHTLTLSSFLALISPDKTNTPGRLALFVTVNAIANADALGDDGDELRRSNYRKIKLLSNYYCQNAFV
ncbi:unnamed protein product, partial [Brassica rapa subsp. trilocularis]